MTTLEPTTPRIANHCSSQRDAAMIVSAMRHASEVIDRLEIARIDDTGGIVIVWDQADSCQDELRSFVEALEPATGGMVLPCVPFTTLAMLRTFGKVTDLAAVRAALQAVDSAIGNALKVLPGAAAFRVLIRRIRQSIASYLASLPG